MQNPHVAPDAGNPEQTGTVIDQMFEHGRIELLFTRQIDQNAGIEIAAPRAHDHATGWSQSHAGIDRYSVLDRGDAGAITEMGDDQAVRRFRKLVHNRFAGKAVEAIALNTSRLKFPGERKHMRALRHFGVECGIETCRLRKPGKMLLGEADDRQG